MKLVACGTWQCTQARRDGRKNFRKQRASARAIKQARFKIRNEGNRYTEIKKINRRENETKSKNAKWKMKIKLSASAFL